MVAKRSWFLVSAKTDPGWEAPLHRGRHMWPEGWTTVQRQLRFQLEELGRGMTVVESEQAAKSLVTKLNKFDVKATYQWIGERW